MVLLSSTTSETMTLIAALTVNVLVVLGGWIKFRSELRSNVEKINQHTDVSVTKLNGMLTNVIWSFDRPCWLKLATKENNGIAFRMLELNEHYENTFKIKRERYIGKTDLEAGWDHKTAQKFHENDLTVWASGKPTTFTEEVNGKKMTFRKIRVTSKNGEAKGILAYSIAENEKSQIE